MTDPQGSAPAPTLGADGALPTGGPPTTTEPQRGAKVRPGDRIFRSLSAGSGGTVLAIMAAITAFLIIQSVPALDANTVNFLTYSGWNASPSGDAPVEFGIAALAFHTVLTSIIAMVIAVPIAIGIALFITFYAPRRLAGPLGYLVDLLAAVPSVVYGLWGFAFLADNLDGLVMWLDKYLGWTVIFAYQPENNPSNRSDFTAGVVLAIMILPIVAALAREVFRIVPTANIEAALALGATKWEMIRTAVLPFGRGGLLSASVLGLGRALGETLAVTMILSASYEINWHITESGGITFASNIALKYREADEVGLGALIASGLVLFAITLLVNSAGQAMMRRKAVK